MTREKTEAFIQLFLLDHGHAVEDEVIQELVRLMNPPVPSCHRCAQKKIGSEVYTVDDLARGVHIQFDVEAALAYAKERCAPQELDDDEFLNHLLVVNLGSFCAEHVAHTNPDEPGMIATVNYRQGFSYVLVDGTHRTVRNCQMGRKPRFYILNTKDTEPFILERSET